MHANASIDTSLIITGAKFNLNQGIIDYTRYFAFLHRLTWVEASVPVAGLGGSISGTNIHGSTTAAGDSSYELAMLVKGGPALSVTQFETVDPLIPEIRWSSNSPRRWCTKMGPPLSDSA